MNRLYAVAQDEKSNQQIARERVKEYRKEKLEPIVNIHDGEEGKRAPSLSVDETLKRTDPGYLLGKKV